MNGFTMLELMCESPSLWTHMADVYSSPCDQLSELLSMFAVYLNTMHCAP